MSIDIMERMRTAFRAEALDLLIELDSALLALEAEPADRALVNRVFRAIHTIKGSGGTAGFERLARFAHGMEEAFDMAREGRLAVTPDLIDCGLKSCDVLRLIIEERAEGAIIPGEAELSGTFLRLRPAAEVAPADPSRESQPASGVRAAYEILFKPNREIFYSGADPVTLLDDLRELGQAHITARTDQVPPLASIEAEHCYLWWEVLLVTDRDLQAIQDVFVFVADQAEVRIRLLEDQASTVALLGSVPAEAFELFVLECEEHLEGIERDALAWENDPAARGNLDALFRGVHSIKGNAGMLLADIRGDALTAAHPLQLLLRVAHGLESLLEPFRGAAGGLVPDETIQTALETCDAIRTLLGNLTHNGAGGPVSPELLQRLGVLTGAPAGAPGVDGREAAFLNTTSQCVEMIAGCFERLESDPESSGTVLETYVRGLRTWSAAARYRPCPELEEPLAQQLRILDAAMRTGAALSDGERSELGTAFQAARGMLGVSTDGRGGPVPESRDAARSARKPPVERPGDSASPATVRIDQNKLDRLMRIVGELLVARGAFPLLIQKLSGSIGGAGIRGSAGGAASFGGRASTNGLGGRGGTDGPGSAGSAGGHNGTDGPGSAGSTGGHNGTDGPGCAGSAGGHNGPGCLGHRDGGGDDEATGGIGGFAGRVGRGGAEGSGSAGGRVDPDGAGSCDGPAGRVGTDGPGNAGGASSVGGHAGAERAGYSGRKSSAGDHRGKGSIGSFGGRGSMGGAGSPGSPGGHVGTNGAGSLGSPGGLDTADGADILKDLKEAGANISRIADELQSSVMSIRMLPVRTVFQRFPRLVRDLARSLGKEIRLVIEGEGIELDKTILEQIGDPLVHVVRNAVDHGLEPPSERRANGKDASGQLTLRATQEAGGVVIEVTDDGRGLDAAALKRKAVERGLVTPEAASAMSDEAACQLVFLPGLSTAAKVTDVSGRGVGMDVVRSNVRNLRGTVEIRSRPGWGTTFRIKLPASLLVSKGILLEAGAQEYILPLSSICDMVKMPPERVHRHRELTLAQVRGNIYPVFSLAEMLGLAPVGTPELSVAIVEAGAMKYGLVVDKFLSEVEVLVKPLTGGLERCKEFQGAAIMGDGRVVLVLNALECHSLDRTACS